MVHENTVWKHFWPEILFEYFCFKNIKTKFHNKKHNLLRDFSIIEKLMATVRKLAKFDSFFISVKNKTPLHYPCGHIVQLSLTLAHNEH